MMRGAARKIEFPKPYADRVARLRVPGGFVLLAAFLWLAHPSAESLLWGLPVSLAGLGLRAWAAGHLAKNQELATGGPYGYIRNPLYAGTLLVAAGLALAGRSWTLAGIFAGVFGLIYLPVIQLEEQHLRSLFPAFAEYCAQVPLLIPRGRRMLSQRRFRWALYRRNEEYQALWGWLAAVAWLLWRAARVG
jgi:protein-S-isoprenylcysteine O-methyltransferase Ste14